MKQATLGAFKLKEDKGDGITTGTLFAKRNKEPEKPSTPLTGKLSMLVNAKALNIFNKGVAQKVSIVIHCLVLQERQQSEQHLN